ASDPLLGLFLVFAGILIFSIGQRLIRTRFIKLQIPIAEDSELAERIRRVVRQFGKEPKQIVFISSMIANGYALRDGTVAITSALRRICTDDEIAAVLA